MVATTQDHLPVQDIRDDVIILKDGSLAIVIQTSAVNFGLLSENEQLAIISAFAGMLNSLSFMIQIIIRSKRLDISSYLKQLDEARARQTNQLLASMIARYRQFIKNTIQENEVLDKQFYIAIPVSYLETGAIAKNVNYDFKKALAVAMPRRDQIIRQLARIGLKATQLGNEELIKLFYDIYNPTDLPYSEAAVQDSQDAVATVSAVQAAQTMGQQTNYRATPDADLIRAENAAEQPSRPVAPAPAPQAPRPQVQPQVAAAPQARRRQYVVEELPEDYGTA
jgi:hypothetical protein